MVSRVLRVYVRNDDLDSVQPPHDIACQLEDGRELLHIFYDDDDGEHLHGLRCWTLEPDWVKQHMIIDIVRLIAGLVTNRDTYPGGPEAWFANLNNSSFVLKNIVYLLTATFGDVIVVRSSHILHHPP